MKKENEKNNIFKSSFFLKLFCIPYITWFVISITALIPDETDTAPITVGDMIITDIILLLIWFSISFVIYIIIVKLKENKPKTKIIKKNQYISKKNEENIIMYEEIKDEKQKIIINKKMKKNNNCLYICENVIDVYEYKKMSKYFPEIYWAYVIWGTILNIILSSLITIASKNYIITLVFFILYQAFIMILYKVRLEHFVEKSFNIMNKKNKESNKRHTEFYEDYFIRQSEKESFKINYTDINRCIETDTNFYLKIKDKNKVIIIQKNTCDLDLINFIRRTFKNVENHLGENSKFKGAKKYHNPSFIRTFMIVLFIITIASLWGALWSTTLIDKLNPQHGFNFTKNTWIFWCWLPIPLLSIILGFKYKGAGFKCTKNIVAGFIIGFLLLIYGSFSLFPTFSQKYDSINKYKEFIDANLPTNGELEIQNWGTYFDDDKTEYTIINAYYDKEDVNNLVKSIENNNKWILSTEIKSELKIFIPSQLKSDDDAYYSIYNKTTNEYNTLPANEGNYEIYAMKYDKSNKQLEIHSFKYSYK